MAMAMMIANAAMQFVGSIYQGEAEGSRLNQAGDAAQANARNTRLQTNATEETQRRQNAIRLGSMRAGASQSGFDPSSGSLVDLQSHNAAELELDALTKRYEGTLQAVNFENEASSYRAGAKNARTTGYLNAFGSLVANGANYFGAPHIGGMAPVETRIPKPNPNFVG
jgi:hypothetical protein